MVEAAHMNNSFYNVNVRDVLFVVGVMAPCSCQRSPFSTKEFIQILDLERKKRERKKKMVKTQIRIDLL